jgi:uncharacterized cupin superfamily protein
VTDLIIMKTGTKGAPQADLATPDRAKLMAGTYKTKTWNFDTQEEGRLFCGIWESTPGKVPVSYDEWEFCHFISGKAVLTNEQGKRWTVKQGDAFIIPAGFKGTWETVEKVRKHYVILMPKG